MRLQDIKATILERRRRRIRRSTYDYVAQILIEDTRYDSPFRDRMVVDWWARVVDPLEAESYDEGRLSYFRARLKEHARAPRANADLRQGLRRGKPLRRLNAAKLAYVKHQIRRLADRRLNYAAAWEAIQLNDTAYRQLLVGLVALPKIQATPKGLLHGAAITARNDRRFATVAAEITDNADAVLPGRPKELIDRHIKLVSEPFDPFWFSQPDKGFEVKQWALLRKLERDYLNKLK